MIALNLRPAPKGVSHDTSCYWIFGRQIDLDSSKSLVWLSLAHELGHAMLPQSLRCSQLEIQADEIAAWLYAFVLRGTREHIDYADECLSSYGVVRALALLHEGCDRLGVP